MGQPFPNKPTARLGKGTIERIAYSPDGKLLAVAGSPGIWLYDAGNLNKVGLLGGYVLSEVLQLLLLIFIYPMLVSRKRITDAIIIRRFQINNSPKPSGWEVLFFVKALNFLCPLNPQY